MAYCPNCRVEYRDDGKECIDCRVPLVAGPPPTPSRADEPGADANLPVDAKVVPIRVFRGPTAVIEADLARNILDSQGIPSILPGEMSAEILPGVDVVQLLVDEGDAEEAAAILESYFDRRAGSESPAEADGDSNDSGGA